MEALQNAIIESHKYRAKQDQKDVVIEAAREFLHSMMDGDLPRTIGAQSRLEGALIKLDEMNEDES